MHMARIPLLSILGVPAAASAVALVGGAVLENKWRDLFATSFPGATPIDLSTVCALDGGQDEVCTIRAALGWIPPLAVVTVIIALITVAIIYFAVSAGGRDPYRIARYFRPVLMTTIAAALALAVLDGALIILAVWYGEPAISGGYRHPFFALAAGAAVAVAAIGMLRGLRKSIRSTARVFGEAVSRADEPQLWATVDDVASAVGTRPPDNIVLGLNPELFVTQTEVRALSGQLKGRTLYLSLPLTRLMDQDELRAILGHELAHFHGEDLEISEKFYPIYGRAIYSLRAVAGVSRAEMVAYVTLASAVGTLRYFLTSLATAELALARERELAADGAGMRVSSPQAMASALVKITAYEPICERLLQSQPPTGGSGAAESIGDQLARAAGPAERELRTEELDQIRLPHPTDSHPTLSVRLQALGTSAQAILVGGLSPKGAPVTDLIPDAASRDSSLTTRLAGTNRPKAAAEGSRRPASTGNAAIDAAWANPAVSKAVEFLRIHRGGSLTWILLPRDRWVVIDDLLVGPQSGASNFRQLASPPTGTAPDRWQVIDLADPDAPGDTVLRSGTRLDIMGVVNRGISASTVDEIVFSPVNGRQAGRLISVGVVCRSPVHHGLAGSLIVPTGDPLISDQARKNELLDLIETALDEVDGLTADSAPDHD